MNGSTLRKQFEKKYEKYFREALKVMVHFRSKDVHSMRIAIKKLRTYIDFISGLTKGKINQVLPVDQLEKVFNQAGKIRECQINLEIAGDKNISKKALAFFEKQALTEIKKSKAVLKSELSPEKIRLKKSARKGLKKLLTGISEKTIEKHGELYIQNQWRTCDKLLHLRNATNAMHQVRICFKRIDAACELFSENKKIKQSERFSGTMQEIGEWHDMAVFCDTLKFICSGKHKKHIEQRTELKKLRLKLEKINNAYGRDILNAVRNFRKQKKRK
jgi:CHAD domain-containing protein